MESTNINWELFIISILLVSKKVSSSRLIRMIPITKEVQNGAKIILSHYFTHIHWTLGNLYNIKMDYPFLVVCLYVCMFIKEKSKWLLKVTHLYEDIY